MPGLVAQRAPHSWSHLACVGRKIQVGTSGHCSVEDARATLDLFKLVRQDYEAELYSKWNKKSNKQTMQELASFVQTAHASRGLRIRADSSGDSQYLGDEYWPSDITEEG
ncbi:interferon-stimulated 20 kDa exonuclease-like 2 [Elysia marginata]|uniref:Interferon-stimulated 20 kDa exonuclease-like 2 n=1 Tax=Elysia marginata TaxID=1093978 RepID=A0AAV4JV01_9GAST|nr:interferon-stimulated 20 kDa exonuclease-like 2 [Elysia marginata]